MSKFRIAACVLAATLSLPAGAIASDPIGTNHNKLSLPLTSSKPKPAPLTYHMDHQKPRKGPNTYPTVVTGPDSRGRPVHGPGVTTHFGGNKKTK